jgi:hypothetical protein
MRRPWRRRTDSAAAENALAHALPTFFARADKASNDAQERYVRLVRTLLICNVAAAVLSGSGTGGVWHDRLALVATGLFVVGVIVAAWLLIEKPDRRWYESRAAAESAKTLATQYAVGGGDFAVGADSAEGAYRQAIAAIPRALPHLPPLGDTGDPVNPELDELRNGDLATRQDIYLEYRLADQRQWYAGRAVENDAAATRWRSTMFVGQIAGVLGGIAVAADVWDVNGLGIAAAATAAATAWLRTKEFERLADAYAVTQRELASIEAAFVRPRDEKVWADFVADTEAAISREHTLWAARRIG